MKRMMNGVDEGFPLWNSRGLHEFRVGDGMKWVLWLYMKNEGVNLNLFPPKIMGKNVICASPH